MHKEHTGCRNGFEKGRVEEPTEHFWDELDHWLHCRSPHPTSVLAALLAPKSSKNPSQQLGDNTILTPVVSVLDVNLILRCPHTFGILCTRYLF